MHHGILSAGIENGDRWPWLFWPEQEVFLFFLGILWMDFAVNHCLQPSSQWNKHCGLHRRIKSAHRSPVERLLNEVDRCGTMLSSTNGIPPIGSGNGMVPSGTKPLPEPMLTYHHSSPVAFIWGQFHTRYCSSKSLQAAWKLYTVESLI